MSVYRVESGGRAPAGLSAGDEVVTGGGTYRITGVNADGSYQSQLVNKNQTTRNYGGSYQTRNSPYTMSGVSDYTRSKLNGLEGGYTPSGSVQAAQAYLEQVKASKPGAYQSRWDDELTSLYDQIRNRKKFSYDMGTDPLYQQYREQYQRLGRLAMQDTMGQAAALGECRKDARTSLEMCAHAPLLLTADEDRAVHLASLSYHIFGFWGTARLLGIAFRLTRLSSLRHQS